MLFFSSNNVIYGNGALFDIDSSCEVSGTWTNTAATAITTDPSLVDMPYDADIDTAYFDPRPSSSSSILFSDVDTVPSANSFLVQTGFKGAFTYEVRREQRYFVCLSRRANKIDVFLVSCRAFATLATTSGWQGSRTHLRTA